MQLNTNKFQKHRFVNIVILASVVLGGIAWAVIAANSASKKSSTTSQSTTNTTASSSTQSASTGGTSNSSGPATSGSGTATTPSVDESVTPTVPSGTFVSSHHLSLSNTGTITSTCTTTPGATCTIQFTQGSAAKSLTSKIADADGNAYWTWTLQSTDLTTGDWKIAAIATNGSKTSSASDSLNLVVSE